MQKIGELLLQDKKITRDQLDQALKHHAMFGLKLGSSLVALGCLDAASLADVLARKFQSEPVTPQELENIPPEILELVPRDEAIEHTMIPFRRLGRVLFVAMAKPKDVVTLDAIGGPLGFTLVPQVVPDCVIAKAMSRYYNYGFRENEYRQLARVKRADPVKTEVKSPFGTPLKFGGFSDIPCPGDHEFESRQVRLAEVAAKAEDRDAIIQALFHLLSCYFECGGVFMFRGNEVWGFRGFAMNQPIPSFERIKIPVSAAPDIMLAARDSKDVAVRSTLGPLLQKIFCLSEGNSSCAIPLVICSRVVGSVVLANNVLTSSNMELAKDAVVKAGMGLEMQLLKQKAGCQ